MEELATFLSEVIGIRLYDVPLVDDGRWWGAGLRFRYILSHDSTDIC